MVAPMSAVQPKTRPRPTSTVTPPMRNIGTVALLPVVGSTPLGAAAAGLAPAAGSGPA